MKKTDETDYEDPAFWLTECERSRERRMQVAQEMEWAKIEKLWNAGSREVTLYRETQEQEAFPFLQTAFVNWVHAYKELFIPAVYWRQPKIMVVPLKHAFQEAARYAEATINATMKLCKFRLAARRAMNDALAYGHGWVKVGWYTRHGEVPPAPGADAKGISTISQDNRMRFDQAYAYRVPVDRITFDPDARIWEEVRWVAQEYYVPVEDFMKDPFMKHTKDVATMAFPEGRETADLPTTSSLPKAGGEHARWVRMMEIWDKANGRVMFHAYGSEKMNRVIAPWPWEGLSDFPFKMLHFTDALDDIYPPSVILPWLPLVEELSFIRSMRLEHMSKMVKKLLTTEGNFNELQRKALLDPSVDLATCGDITLLKDFDGLKPDPNMYACEEEVKKDIREISGFSEILSGQVPFSRIAATTSKIMEQNATLRFDSYSEWMADWILDVAKDLFQIVRKYQQYPAMVEIAGEMEPQWIELGPKQLEGEFNFSLDLEEMSQNSKQQRIKEEFDALSVLSQFPEVRRHSLIKDFLIAFGKTDIPLYLNPPAGPPADPTWENQMMSQGYPVDPNPGEDFQLHLRVHQMFMQQPTFQQLAQARPEVGKVFNEHLQTTMRMAQMSQGLGQGGPGAAPGGGGGGQGAIPPTPGLQQGQPLAGSQAPFPGAQGPAQRGQGQANMQQAQAAARRGM